MVSIIRAKAVAAMLILSDIDTNIEHKRGLS